jgi:phenylpropionate dioxygenase-like ring-hydroxylating dioxygenase large terminal subunit
VVELIYIVSHVSSESATVPKSSTFTSMSAYAPFQPIVRQILDQLAVGGPIRSTGGTFPASDYADTSHLQHEFDTLFSGFPQAVALSPDLPEPGSQITRDGLGLPVVLTRDEEGKVHALANVCAHRGAQVVEHGRHCSKRLTCPYHGWSYQPDGTLVGLPDAGSFPDRTTPAPGMRSLPVVEEHGVIWVTPSFDAEPPSPGLGPIADDLDHFSITTHHHWRSHRFELDLNWKLVIDTFLEGYHFSTLHRNTVGPLFVANLCVADRFGPHVREVLPRRTFASLADQEPEQWDLVPHTALVYVLFPNTVFVMQTDHIETWRVMPHPTDPSRSTTDLDFYVPQLPETDSALRHWEANWRITIDTVIEEDFAAMAGVQRGLASGALEQITAGQNEPALAMFHQSLVDAR